MAFPTGASRTSLNQPHRLSLPIALFSLCAHSIIRTVGRTIFYTIIRTETVYGLGANAYDENAVLSIFKTKGRPLTGAFATARRIPLLDFPADIFLTA